MEIIDGFSSSHKNSARREEIISWVIPYDYSIRQKSFALVFFRGKNVIKGKYFRECIEPQKIVNSIFNSSCDAFRLWLEICSFSQEIPFHE